MNVLANRLSITSLAKSHEIASPSGFIRGGRLRKTSKGLISFAPFLTGASVLALGALMATTTPVEAGDCTEESGMTGVWTCSGPAGDEVSGHDGGQTIRGRANQNIDVTGDATFGLDSIYHQDFGIKIQTVTTTGTIDVNLLNDNDIASYENAIDINQDGTGAVTIHTNGTIYSEALSGIDIHQSGNGNITVTTDGTVEGNSGIYIITTMGTTGEINVTTNAAVTGEAEGILLDVSGNNAVTVVASGTVTSAIEEAIWVEHRGMGDVNITTGGTVTANAAAKDAIYANHTGTGSITLTVNGSVVGGSSANAIDLSTASGDATIILGADASFTRGIDVSGVMGTASLEIGGTGDRSFDIGNIPAITGDRNFNKNSGHTLTVTGTHASGAAFEQTNINEGKLIWEGTDFRTTSLAIADGATLEITGSGSFTNTSVTLSGRLELTGNSSNITVGSLAGNGGIDIDVDFSGGDAELANARLTATSATGSTTVNIRSVGGFPEIPEDEENRTVSIGNLIGITGTANADAFVMGRPLNGGFRFVELLHDDSSGENVWTVVAEARSAGNIEDLLTDITLIEAALYESFPSALAQLASLESYRQRLQGRRHGNNDNVWAKISGFSAEFEPIAATLATYEIEDVAATFGIDVPLRTDHPYVPDNITVGASAAFGEATTDVTVGNSTGEIATTTFKASASANWEYNDIYVDGQLQYAIFGNKVKSDTKLASEAATAYSAGLEVGYGLDIGGFRVIPSAQLTWTSIDFDDFKDSATTEVVLDDGTVLAGRAGVEVEKAIPSADILLRGHADLLMPLDEKVNTKVNGTELASEREDPVFDVGVGATYAWDETYMLTADISTQQGSEVKGYDANIGLKYKF